MFRQTRLTRLTKTTHWGASFGKTVNPEVAVEWHFYVGYDATGNICETLGSVKASTGATR